MDKHTFKWKGDLYYLIGIDKHGRPTYLQQAHFDCNWYWGLGYIETFTNKQYPERSKDITTHRHFDKLVLTYDGQNDVYDRFNQEFPETPLTTNEIWELLELMRTAYICRHYSDMLYTGGAHITPNPLKPLIQNEEEYNRINKDVIPDIMNKVYELLS